MNKYSSKIMAPVMDLDYDLSCAFHTPELLERKIRMLAERAGLKLYGCDLSGKRVEEIPLTTSGSSVSFLAETVRDSKARFMVYELVASGK